MKGQTNEVRRPKRKKPKLIGEEAKLVRLSSLRPNDWNPNRMTKAEEKALAEVFRTNGWSRSNPLLVWATDEEGKNQNVIVDGEHRWKVARKLGYIEGPAVELRGVTRKQAIGWTIRLDKLRGRFDEDALAVVLRDELGIFVGSSSRTNGLGLRLGFDPDEIDSLRIKLDLAPSLSLGMNGANGARVLENGVNEIDEGDAQDEEDLRPIDSKLGELYELGPHRLICGDSTDSSSVARVLGKVEPKLWIVDPPFDLDYSKWLLLPSIDVAVVWHRSLGALVWAAATFDARENWGLHHLVFTGGVRGQHNHTLPCCMHENVMVLRRHWWKRKEEAIDRAVVLASGAKATVDDRPISWQERSGGVVASYGEMSWSKPLLQTELAMAYVPKGAPVWDPCAGSGSSLIAADKHGRIWRGAELSPKWCDLIRRRWARHAEEKGIKAGKGALEP